MVKLGLSQSRYIIQLIHKREGGKLVLVVAKIADDPKAAETEEMAQDFIEEFNKTFKLGGVNHGPGKLRRFGMTTTQNEDFTIEEDAEDKMDSLTKYPITRHRCRQVQEGRNAVEKSFLIR